MPTLKPAPTLKPFAPRRMSVQRNLANQRVKVSTLASQLSGERNAAARAARVKQLHSELLKMKLMMGAAQGKKTPTIIVRPPAPTSQRPRTGFQTLAMVREITAKAVVPQRATTAATSAGIPADPAALTEVDVQNAVIEAEAVEKALASSQEVPAAVAAEVAEAAMAPADDVIAEAAGEGGSGINLTTVALGIAVAAGVYFLVLKK